MHRGSASRIVEQQKQQHSSSSTAAVVAATSRLRTKRTSVDAPVSLLFRSCAFAQFEKDERGHTAKSFVNHCCFTVPLNTLRVHAYTIDSSISVQTSFFWCFVEHLGLSFESFTVQAVREFSPVSFPVSC